jgi:hypothetical protein
MVEAVSAVSPAYSPPPKLFEITVAPRVAAVFSAAARLTRLLLVASTSRILQFWQIACAVSTSSAISSAQPAFRGGVGPAAPLWLTFAKQPFARRAGGQPEGRAEDAEVALDRRRVIGVDDRDRLAGRARGGRP